jgi:hypothetical protein
MFECCLYCPVSARILVVWIYKGAGTLVRYRDDYDRYITIYLLHSIDDAKAPIPRSFTDIYRIVTRSGNPKVGKDTVQRHLNRLVEEKTIVKLQREGRQYNKTLYILSPKGMVMANIKQKRPKRPHKASNDTVNGPRP